MSFVKRNKRELIVASFVALAVISTILLFALTAPISAPFLFASASLAVTAKLATVGITLSPVAAWHTAAAVASLIGGLFSGLLSGLFTKAINLACCTPDVQVDDNGSMIHQSSAFQDKPIMPLSQQGSIATQLQAPAQHQPTYTVVPAGDPTQTTRGTEIPAYLTTNTGDYADHGYYNPQTNIFTSVMPKTSAQSTESNDLTPVYMRTNS